MARINTYPLATSLTDNDVILIDGAKGGNGTTRTITFANLKKLVASGGDPFSGVGSAAAINDTDVFLVKTHEGPTRVVPFSLIRSELGVDLTPIPNSTIDGYFNNI